jgi:methyl-accepting chemotaxis protein
VLATEEGSAQASLGAEKADEAGQALQQILLAVNSTSTQMREIATAAQSMTSGARRVNEAMESISAVTHENSAATEQMAAQAEQVQVAIDGIATVSENQSGDRGDLGGAEEMSAQVEHISAVAADMAGTAEELRHLVARFVLDEGETTSNGCRCAARPDASFSTSLELEPERFVHDVS